MCGSHTHTHTGIYNARGCAMLSFPLLSVQATLSLNVTLHHLPPYFPYSRQVWWQQGLLCLMQISGWRLNAPKWRSSPASIIREPGSFMQSEGKIAPLMLCVTRTSYFGPRVWVLFFFPSYEKISYHFQNKEVRIYLKASPRRTQ